MSDFGLKFQKQAEMVTKIALLSLLTEMIKNVKELMIIGAKEDKRTRTGRE